MNLNKRERLLGILVASALLLLLLDSYVLTPYFDGLDALAQQIETLQKDYNRKKLLSERVDLLESRYKEAMDGGLGNLSQAQESAVLHALRAWASESRVSISIIRPERVKDKDLFELLPISFSAEGRLQNMSAFLNKTQQSVLPLRIDTILIGSKQGGTDELRCNIELSVLCKKTSESKSKMKQEPADAK